MTPAAANPGGAWRALLIIWIIFVAMIPVYYYVVTHVLSAASNLNDDRFEGDPQTFRIATLGAAILVAALSVVLKQRLGFQRGQPKSLLALRQAYIVAFSCSLSPAVMGIAIFATTAWAFYWVFFVISGLAFVLNFPRREYFDPPRTL